MRRLLPLLALALPFAAPSLAHANGRFPAANQLVAAPSDPSVLVLRTTFGLLISRDAGATWDWVCESAIGFSGQEDPSIGVTATNAIVAGLYEGLSVSPDNGCAWAFADGELGRDVVLDVVVRPDAPHTVLALTSAYSNDGGVDVYQSQVHRSTDDGAHWEALGVPLDSAAALTTLEVARSDPHRLYAAGTKGNPRTGYLYVSTDDGANWTEHAIALGESEYAPYISAVDPADPGLVYVRTSGDGVNRLLVSHDAGEHFDVAYTGESLLGFALSPDGAKVYLGGSDGLRVAPRDTLQFVQKWPSSVECLAARGDTLFVCSNEVGGFLLGSSTDDGATLTPRLHLWTVRGPLACPAETTASRCVAEWPAVRDNLGVQVDGGAQADAGPSAAPNDDGSCGCRIGAAQVRGMGVVGAFGVAGALLLRRRRRRNDEA